MNQELFTPGDKVLYLRYYECEVIDVMEYASKATLMYLIKTLDTGRKFIAYPNDLRLLE